MDARYGRSKRAKRDRSLVIWLGGGMAAALVVWIFVTAFSSMVQTSGEVKVFNANSAASATVIIDVKKPMESKAVCSVSVMNGAGGAVGSKQVVVDLYASTVQLNITTTEPGSDAQVDFCHKVD